MNIIRDIKSVARVLILMFVVDDDQIWVDAWHEFTDQYKGKRGTVRIWKGSRIKYVPKFKNGVFRLVRRRVSVWEDHNRKIQVLTVDEFRKEVIGWAG